MAKPAQTFCLPARKNDAFWGRANHEKNELRDAFIAKLPHGAKIAHLWLLLSVRRFSHRRNPQAQGRYRIWAATPRFLVLGVKRTVDRITPTAPPSQTNSRHSFHTILNV